MGRHDHNLEEHALQYVKLGFAVFPLHSIRADGRCTCGSTECGSPGKHPKTLHGVKDATRDAEQVRAWWKRYPDSNIGIAVPRGVVVLDVDPDKGGLESLQGKHIPEDAPCCRTGGGGFHYWFRLPDGVDARNATGILPGLDIRAVGGYVVAPPSNHASGRRYEWEQELVPPDRLPPAPEWLVQMLTPAPAKRNGERKAHGVDTAKLKQTAVASWREGKRHQTALAVAGLLRKRGVPEEEASALVAEIASEAHDPELQDRLRAVEDTYRQEPDRVAGFSRLPKPLQQAVDDARETVEPEKTYRHLIHLRELFAGRFRWCPEWKTWLRWDGVVWQRVPTESVVAEATETLRGFYAEQVAQAPTHAEAEKWSKRLVDLFTTSHVQDAVELLRGYDGFLTPACAFDADPYIMNLQNGILNLRTLELTPHDPDALCTKVTNASYTPNAKAPRWQRFLHEIFAGDTGLIDFLQRACGMALIGENRHHLLFILHGTGANGKSTFLRTLRFVFGSYGGAIPRDALLARRHQQDGQRTAYASLTGLRFATLEELADEVTLSVVAVKDLTSGNPMAVRALYENYREVELGLTPFIASNTKPAIHEHTEGTWRRLRLVPFNVVIPPEKRDSELVHKLECEADGIFAWLVGGLRDYWTHGLQEPPAVVEATREYRSEQDVLEGFIAECCEIAPRATTPSAELYEAYRTWALAQGEREEELLSERAFGQRLTKRGFSTAKGTGGARLRRGLRLRTSGNSGVSGVVSEKSLRENDSAELFQNNATNATNATAFVEEQHRQTPLGVACRAIENALRGGARLTLAELARKTGLPRAVLEDGIAHMLHTGELESTGGSYRLVEVADDG